ncbi:MAG: hypothetical protein H7X93_07100, partial [Sphingomonadaceae bacterium]|nr:hypothetical protein [Sphingomonadaceae bacterium]
MIARERIRPADAFAATNVTLFLLMAWLVYYDRLIAYRGYANVHEFFIYACVILAVIVACWWWLRKADYPGWLLLLLQVGILAHFAGAFMPIESGRLYDAHVLGVRYDKYVHAFNAFAGAAFISHLLGLWGARLPLKWLCVTGLVLGAGTVVEIVEYLVMLTVPNAGVGGYDNNMQDLISNLAGGTLWSAVAAPLVALARE